MTLATIEVPRFGVCMAHGASQLTRYQIQFIRYLYFPSHTRLAVVGLFGRVRRTVFSMYSDFGAGMELSL